MPEPIFAFDKDSTRRIDAGTGHMHVGMSNISKANVCPYLGNEIPCSKDLGLDQLRVYKLLRDPKELEKAAPSFAGKPLLIIHKPVNSKDHPYTKTVGSIGSNVTYNHPYLKADLVAWTDEAIAGIESEEQEQLSSSYSYDPDMTPGEYEGEKYDGVMRNIRGNHVALVDVGRAGPDVVVGDAALKKPKQEITLMKIKPLSRKAAQARGALTVYLQPKLAQDAQIDLGKVLTGVTAGNWKANRPKIVTALKSATKGKLAQDADIEDVIELLDKLDGVTDEVAGVMDDPDKADTSDDGLPTGKAMDFLKGKLSEEEMAQLKDLMGPEAAEDEDLDGDEDDDDAKKAKAKKDAKDKAAKDKAAKDKAAKDKEMSTTGVTKEAMDAAIADASTKAADRVRKDLVEAARAREAVRPYIGAIDVAMDSAPEIYKMALDHLKVDISDVPPEAYPGMLRMVAKPGEATRKEPVVAMDSAATAKIKAMFPNDGRLSA